MRANLKNFNNHQIIAISPLDTTMRRLVPVQVQNLTQFFSLFMLQMDPVIKGNGLSHWGTIEQEWVGFWFLSTKDLL